MLGEQCCWCSAISVFAIFFGIGRLNDEAGGLVGQGFRAEGVGADFVWASELFGWAWVALGATVTGQISQGRGMGAEEFSDSFLC